MKNLAVFFLLACLVVTYGCKKTKTTSVDLKMSANVNNIPWRSYSAVAGIGSGPGTNIVITADSTNSRIDLHIANYHGAGIYTVTDSGTTATYYNFRMPSGAQKFVASSGEIVVTSNVKSSTSETALKGTFKFTSGTYSVTNGMFDVTLNLN